MEKGKVRLIQGDDIPAITSIYNYYVQNTCISFEEAPITQSEMADRVAHISGSFPWVVYEEAGKVAGYAYAGPWKERAAYRFTGEVTVYVDRTSLHKGIGSILYEYLLREIRKTEMHSLMAVIALPNEASVRIHEKFGFRKTAHFREVGYKFGTWIDVGYWQLIL